MAATHQDGTVRRDVVPGDQHALTRKIHAHWQEMP
jgi:hypothetical protein